MNLYSEVLIEDKNYQWLLSEMSKQKSKLKILESAFIKSDHVEAAFYTNAEGDVAAISNKNLSVRDILKKYLTQRISGLESREILKPVAYALYSSKQKILFESDIQDILKKNILKLHNLKELYLFEEYAHEFSTYYNLDLYYEDEGLKPKLTRKDIYNPEFSTKDNKYYHIIIDLSEYLVKIIESILDKNIIKFNFDFVIDLDFMPIVLSVNQIKISDPKIIALNKGLNADQLENLTLLKNEYKNIIIPRRTSVIKEPDFDFSPKKISEKTAATGIFTSFISKFLSRESNKVLKNKKSKTSMKIYKNGIEAASDDRYQEKQHLNFAKTLEVPIDSERNSAMSSENSKKKNKPIAFSTTTKINNKVPLFPNLLPSRSMLILLKNEEERVQEILSKRDEEIGQVRTLPSIKRENKRKKKEKNRIKIKNKEQKKDKSKNKKKTKRNKSKKKYVSKSPYI